MEGKTEVMKLYFTKLVKYT